MFEEKLFLALLGASSAHGAASRQVFAELGLTEGQPKILYILRRKDGQVQRELAARCGIRPSTLAVLLATMEKRGLIYREICHVSCGKRASRVLLTQEGKSLAERLEEAVENLERRSLKGFTAEEQTTLFQMLERVERNLKESVE